MIWWHILFLFFIIFVKMRKFLRFWLSNNRLHKKIFSNILQIFEKIIDEVLTLSAPNLQNDQTHSNNSSAKANDLFEDVWPFCGLELKVLRNNLSLWLSYDLFLMAYLFSNFDLLESHIALFDIGFKKCFFFFYRIYLSTNSMHQVKNALLGQSDKVT